MQSILTNYANRVHYPKYNSFSAESQSKFVEYAAFFVHMFFKKTSSFFHEISISFSYSSSILRNVLRRNKREPNELQTSSFFTSFISLNVPHRVDSRALLPHSVYAEPKIGNSSFLPILPLFFTHCPLPGAASPAVRQTKNDRLCVTISFVVQRCF